MASIRALWMRQMLDGFATIAETGRALRRGDITPLELTQAHLDRIEAHDIDLNAYVLTTPDRALLQAEAAGREIAAGMDRGPMHGIPYAVKDLIDVAGLPTTCHSKIVPVQTATSDAPVVARLQASGAVMLGKTALHEFATGGPAFDLPFPPARNPWNRDHHPGGSSSGSGSALAAGMAMAALGTDTAGSIRNPATCCGIIGLKPTYDLMSREGVFPLSFSLDHVGPMARTVEDTAILFEAMAGKSTQTAWCRQTGMDLKGLCIGTLEQFHEEGGPADDDVEAGFQHARAALADLGATLVRMTVPALAEFQSCGRTILQSESYAIHRRWLRERPQDYCDLSRHKLAAGALIGAADFIAAQQARRRLARQFAVAMQGLDAAICLSSFTTPCRIDDPAAIAATYERHARMPFNVTGAPALATPVGIARNGLPLGIQIVAKPYEEAMLFRIGHALEALLPPLRPTIPSTQKTKADAIGTAMGIA